MTPAPRAEPRPLSSTRGKEDRPDPRCVDDFERALRGKQQFADDSQQHEEAPLPPGVPTPTTSPFPLDRLSQLAAALAPVRGGSPAAEPPARPAAADLALSAPAGATAARAFEVSLNEPLGLSIALRVSQPEPAARWSLSISSTHLNPAQLKRNAERLDTRLRSKALTHEPVHIEDDEPPP